MSFRKINFPAWKNDPSLRFILATLVIFLVAVTIRFLHFQDFHIKARTVQTVVVENYFRSAEALLQLGPEVLLDPNSEAGNMDSMGHPPGFPIVCAVLAKLFGSSDAAIQAFLFLADACSALLVFLIATRLYGTGTGFCAGMMIALSPQFAYNSILLLPDTFAVLPLLAALLLLAFFLRTRSLVSLFFAGCLVSLSCWLRANALLLAPFLVCLFPLLFGRTRYFTNAATFLGGAILVLAPLTIRNAVITGQFVPVSLGAGQTLLEGIADYDKDGRFGIPSTDVEITRMEAMKYGRPDYSTALFSPDGVTRERLRLRLGFSTIRRAPLWFAGVMVRRGLSMLRLERTLRVFASPPVDGESGYIERSNASFQWSRLVRIPIHYIQNLFITVVMLPLYLLGIWWLIKKKRFRELMLIAAIPAYYIVAQSALHTEYRYVLAIHYCLMIIAAVGIVDTIQWARYRRSGRLTVIQN